MTKRIVIAYFPKAMKYGTSLLFGVAVYLAAIAYPIWAGALTLIGLIILTTNYVTEIDLTKKVYLDYLSMMGLKLDMDKNQFQHIDRIVISKGNYEQTVNTRVQSRQFEWTDFTGTLIFDNDTLDLVTRNEKEDLLRALKEFSDFLQVGVQDRTTGTPYWVDMSKV